MPKGQSVASRDSCRQETADMHPERRRKPPPNTSSSSNNTGFLAHKKPAPVSLGISATSSSNTPASHRLPGENLKNPMNSAYSSSAASRARSRLAQQESSDCDQERPIRPPTRASSNRSATKQPQSLGLQQSQLTTTHRNGSLISATSNGLEGYSATDEATANAMDLIVAKKYAANRGHQASRPQHSIPLPPPTSCSERYYNEANTPRRPLQAGIGVLLEDLDTQALLRGKNGQHTDRTQERQPHRPQHRQRTQNHNVIEKNQEIRITNIPRMDSQSTVVPEPPSLNQDGHYITPGAFRMSSGGVPRRALYDNASLISSVRSYPTTRTRRSLEQATMVEAKLVGGESLPDDEYPEPPSPAAYGVSTGEFTQYTTLTTGTTFTATSAIVEAQPLEEGLSIRDFFRTWKVRFTICGLVVMFVILALGTAYGITGFSSESNLGEVGILDPEVQIPTSSPTAEGDPDLEYFLQVAIPDYTRAALARLNSPQNKAFQWLKNNNTLLASYSTSKRLQRFALATFFFATGGDRRWENRTGWLTDDDECTWFSNSEEWATATNSGSDTPVCDSEQSMMRLSLVANNMRGTFPLELSLLTSLEVLEMPRNILTGFLPSTLGEMSLLRSIRLFDNYLSGTLPSELGDMPSLEFLDVEFNFLAQILPETLGRLTKLKRLLLDRNLLRGSIPREFGELSELETFYLFNNGLSGTIPPEIGNLSNLQDIRWEVNRLSGALPSAVGQLSNLYELNIGNNTLSGTIPSEIGGLSQLTYMDLFLNYMTGVLPTELGSLSSLKRLYLERNKFEGSIPTEIGKLNASLEKLWLYDNWLTGSIPSELGFLTKLTSLDLSYNAFEGNIPTELGLLTNLEELSLENGNFTGTVPTELGLLTAMSVLKVYGNFLGGTIPDEICKLRESGVLTQIEVDCPFVRCTCCNCLN